MFFLRLYFRDPIAAIVVRFLVLLLRKSLFSGASCVYKASFLSCKCLGHDFT